MADEFKKGDKVVWSSHGNNDTPGVVERKITSETEAGRRKVKASKDEPQYLVKSDKSGGEAVHKPSALRKRGVSTVVGLDRGGEAGAIEPRAQAREQLDASVLGRQG